MGSPKVSVVMPVYNGEKHLAEAVESILRQTFRDFEFIIIDDGSTDGSPDILRRYQKEDDRVRVYQQENRGCVAASNRGCQLARGEYVARMDHDDVSLPQRLAKQVSYLEAHPEIGVLGTWIQEIDSRGLKREIRPKLTKPRVVAWGLCFESCLPNPTVMMQRAVIERIGFYGTEVPYADDYDLWVRASSVTQLANIPEVLLLYRVWPGSLTYLYPDTVQMSAAKVAHSRIASFLGSEVPMETVLGLRKAVTAQPLASLQEVEDVGSLIRRLCRAFMAADSPNREEVREYARFAGTKLFYLANAASRFSLRRGLSFYIEAVRLNPWLLSPMVVMRGLTVIARRRLKRPSR
ncbi:MAG: glycosyltransferase family 2 protein [Dehalococcoidia bacterium]|nr:glycosyltransferase family 2 protein [Dehalococcoidia bacterium]